ncbi:MAG: ATP-grasp fold amidoligase family protein [Knoellia sp.]
MKGVRVPHPLAVKKFLRDPLMTLDPRRTAYRRLMQSVSSDPSTFTEKLIHKMAFDRNPLLHNFADKIEVRGYVASRVGSEVLPEPHGTFDRADQLNGDALPREFVLKAAHGSGAVAVVWDGAPRGSRPTADQSPTWDWRDQIHPDDLDRAQLARLAAGWLDLSYGLTFRRPEWAYSGLQPRLLVEEVLRDAHGELPSDVKLYLMHGRCTAIDFHLARFTDHRGLFLSRTWEVLPGNHVGRAAPDDTPPRPDNLDRMIEIAEGLSADVDFIRVDLHDLGDRVVFGELTNYPGAANRVFVPPEFDRDLGAAWHPPRRYA